METIPLSMPKEEYAQTHAKRIESLQNLSVADDVRLSALCLSVSFLLKSFLLCFLIPDADAGDASHPAVVGLGHLADKVQSALFG